MSRSPLLSLLVLSLLLVLPACNVGDDDSAADDDDDTGDDDDSAGDDDDTGDDDDSAGDDDDTGDDDDSAPSDDDDDSAGDDDDDDDSAPGDDDDSSSAALPIGTEGCVVDDDCASGVCWDFSTYDPWCGGTICTQTCSTDTECHQLFTTLGAPTPLGASCGFDGRCDPVGTGLGQFWCA